jgi:DNA-binding XRE family transcriptional regulator
MVQIIKTEGDDEIVVMSRREYDALLARLGDEAAEDRMSVRLIREAASEARLPAWLAEAMMGGQTAIEAARKHAGITQMQAAEKLGIVQSYYSAIENGKKGGRDDLLDKMAELFGVEAAWLRPDDEVYPPG